MEFEIAFQDGTGLADVEIALSGVATPAGFFRFTDTLQNDPRFRAGLRLLVDLTGFDATALPSGGVAELSEPVLERDWEHLPAAVAIIAPDPQTFEGGAPVSRQPRRVEVESTRLPEQSRGCRLARGMRLSATRP